MTNKFIDTRGNVKESVTFTQAVVDGLAMGGGLYVPQEIPHMELDEILALADMPYAKRAANIYKRFDIDMTDEMIDSLMEDTYGSQFDTEEICPITSLDSKTHILELWHGPTSAFKDMALQCLPRFFSASVSLLREQGKLDRDFMILVATSGDTGKAALEGFRDVDNVSISVLYPYGGVSDIQYKQMATQRGGNVNVWSVNGNFDDCQSAVKAVFSDDDFAEKLLSERNTSLSSANSINWGRLLPQVVYYISSYAMLVKKGQITAGEEIDVCVPTGNFGNILAAWYAKIIGTPIKTLICASNENCVLTDFIRTGCYDIADRKFVLTTTPSMDILISSNLERQLFELSGRNTESIAQWMKQLKEEKKFQIDEETFAKVKENYVAGYAENNDCLQVLKEVFDTHHYLMDPHTAVAYEVAKANDSGRPVLIASTAHWAKFGENVYRGLHELKAEDALPEEIAALTGCELNALIEKETQASPVPKGLAELESLPIRFTEVIESDTAEVENATMEFLARIKK